MSLTMGQHLTAKRIKTRNPGASYRYIASKVGATERQIRDALDAGTVMPRRRKINPLARKDCVTSHHGKYYIQSGRAIAGIPEPTKMVVPDEVLAERERRLSLTPRSLTAALFGDPLPGRSALDKRQGA